MKHSRFLALALALLMLIAAFPAQAAPDPSLPTPPLMPSDNPKDYMRPFDDETLTSYTVKSPNPFAVVYEDPYFGRTMYFHHVKNTVCSYMDPEALGAAINALPKLPEYAGASETPYTRFITVDEDDNYEKHIYELHTDCLEYDGKAYALTTAQYGALHAAFKKSLAEETGYSSYPYWLVWMNPERVTGMTHTDASGKRYAVKAENLNVAAQNHRDILVQQTAQVYDPLKVGIDVLAEKSGVYTIITFDSSVKYYLYMNEKYLYVESSDQTYGVRYTFRTDVISQYKLYSGMMADACTGIVPPDTAKPVIYLYPKSKTDVNVKLDFKGELVTTIPEYNGGWNVTAEPDGTIADKADGKKYPYLFWDGNADFNAWDFSSGFCVSAEETESFLRKKLPALGLLPHEYEEFIEFWTPVLKKNRYNLITFATQQYENIAPLDVTPEPDTVIRVHMVYGGLDKPVDIPAQRLAPPPARNGFTLVEWGGTKAG